MDVVDAAGAASGYQFSLFGLFFSADWVVKSVMIGLLAASVWCWAVIFSKVASYARARREVAAFERAFASGKPLDELYESLAKRRVTGLSAVFVAAMEEWNGSFAQNAASPAGLQSRLQIALDLAVSEQSDMLQHQLSLLATVGSAAPFIGLFGTVWGIMNAFTAIAASENTSLAVVAPGIAEALFATALGLLAAIPAVIAYNKLSADAGKLIAKFESFADRFTALLSRQLDSGNPG